MDLLHVVANINAPCSQESYKLDEIHADGSEAAVMSFQSRAE